MELRQIQYFIQVAKMEHVTEASHVLNVAQSAVSRQILKLEAELGVSLFIHEGRKVRLTPIGRTFLKHMETMMKVIDKAKQEINEYLDPERGTIQIGFPSSLASHLVPMVVSSFREQHPQVRFLLQHGSYRELIDWVVRGDLNLALIGPVPQEDQIQSDILFTEKFYALVPVGHPLADTEALRLVDLRDDQFVLFPSGYVLRDIVVEACERNGFKPNIVSEGDDLDAIRGLVAAGLGVTLLPEVAVKDNIPASMRIIPIVEPEVIRNVGIITAANRELPPTERLFYQFLKSLYA